MRHKSITLLLLAALSLHGCSNDDKKISSIEGYNIKVTASEKSNGAEEVRNIIQQYSAKVEEIKRPVIGSSAKDLIKTSTPDSPLMNFAADALLTMAQRHCDEKIDLAITNKGGLRNDIAKGDVTYGDIYNVFPFENTLALLKLNGIQLMELFNDIAKVGGECISGARITITTDGKVTEATIGGKEIQPDKKYLIATSDYLSQGNDKMYTLSKGSDVVIKSDITIRDLMITYVSELHKKGEAINPESDGRITIK